MICWVSTCNQPAEVAFQGRPWCRSCCLRFQGEVGQLRFDAQQLDLKRKTPQVPEAEAHEVAKVARWANPPRYRLTHRNYIREVNGGLPSLGKDQ